MLLACQLKHRSRPTISRNCGAFPITELGENVNVPNHN